MNSKIDPCAIRFRIFLIVKHILSCKGMLSFVLSFNIVVLTCISSTELANIWTKKCTLPNRTVSHTCQWDVSLKTRPDEGYVWARQWASRVSGMFLYSPPRQLSYVEMNGSIWCLLRPLRWLISQGIWMI